MLLPLTIFFFFKKGEKKKKAITHQCRGKKVRSGQEASGHPASFAARALQGGEPVGMPRLRGSSAAETRFQPGLQLRLPTGRRTRRLPSRNARWLAGWLACARCLAAFCPAGLRVALPERGGLARASRSPVRLAALKGGGGGRAWRGGRQIGTKEDLA